MLRVRRLGRVPYHEADALQRALARRSPDDYLLFVEHPHVYTLGVRADPAHVLVDPGRVGAALVHTDRGGDVTYHGPGQLVCYPVLDVPDRPGAGPEHVRRLEQVVISALLDVGAGALDGRIGLLSDYPGVWLDPGGPAPAKLAAVGVRTLRIDGGRRRTLHGVAVNVRPDLSMFEHIVPCGISHLAVTSLANEGVDVTLAELLAALVVRAVAEWGTGRTVDDEAGGSTATPGDRPAAAGPVPVDLRLGERSLVRRLRQAGVDPDAGRAINDRKPAWLRAPVRMGAGYRALGRTLADLGLVTVCEEAGCPNIYECWSQGTATFMINGDRCTRACGFCLVDTRHPLPLDPDEPERVAEAVARMDLAHAVVTCVARDDLADGGAGAMAATVEAIRRRRPGTAVETLISDCRGVDADLTTIFAAAPDVLNHNIETVARLQRAVRPSAGYARSLSVLARAADAGLVVKSGLMVGLGETEPEVVSTLADLASVGVSIATVGQYLRPSAAHLPVARWWAPEEFDRLRRAGLELGLAHVQASPLTRSSYHARDAAGAAGVTSRGERSEVAAGR
ncbi:MAG TPA: lipoyl synthase [Acidimicrobiales bacterium]|nr:lipoyl synthase [Acidimicrobiales bacterium]